MTISWIFIKENIPYLTSIPYDSTMIRKTKIIFSAKKIIKLVFPWVLFLSFIILFPPSNIFLFIIFYVLLFFSLLSLLELFFSNSFSILLSLFISVIFLFQQLGFLTPINLLLLFVLFITLSFYFKN
ncbi:hypothetical protein A3D77_05280 [Candidatus Gottesmanbacteria bacterium RIFCSPHIGHO2_02_FULL_39_11]|uniref:Uncharacterized protein n=1 Tax=Candidatus Gottesmanbacteria bacterium RIFCSPHIGHO2_02_FULL_39_11 TaxID=1798382 RepID=A0A1F5ZMB8_9BACT|nr:MAG: hypothetical protein A3D77_05280 [Candidatus Gottesmanbacteria bacterium RIFCSPHIGHO2_02_FULL_39_11]